MHSAHRFRVLATVATVVTLACGGARKKDTAGGEAGRQLALESIYDRLMTMSPTAAVALGYHEFDGRLPAIGQADLEAQINSLRLMEQQLKSPVPGRELDQQILLAEIRGRRFQLEVMARPWRDPLFYLSKLGIDDYVSRPYASAVVRSQAIIRLARATPGFLMAAERNLSKPMPRTYVQTGLLVARGLISFANDDARKQLGSLPPAKRKALDQALGEYTSALEAHARFLEDKLERANDDFRLGKESFLRMLEMTEGLTISLEDLQSIATSDLERNRQALIDAALELAPDATTAQAVEQVRRDRPTPSELLSQARAQSAAMKKFIIDRDIVTIPSSDPVEVRETPPFMRWNFAFLSSPGVFEPKALPAFYYITPPDPTWPLKQQTEYVPSRSDLLFVTVHEVWPGHFLHGLHIKSNPSKIARSFCSYAMSEGWAHYTEEMMWNQGAASSPAEHIGQLQNALLRNVRFLVALGLHTGKMTVDEAEQLFVEAGFQDRASARQQATRGTFDPGFLNYTLGKLMIRKLHDDWKKARGSSYSLKEFHDRFLSHACAPIPVIRRSMLGDDAGPPL